MRMSKMLVVAILVSIFFLGTFSNAAEVNKIGIVDFQRIIQLSEAGKEADAEIKEQGEKLRADLLKKNAEIEEISKRLEREALVMDKNMRDEKERELRIRLNDFKLLERKYKEEIKILNLRLVDRLQKEIVKYAEEIGKNEGYLLIIEKREGGVVYAPNVIDLTDRIIPLLKKKS